MKIKSKIRYAYINQSKHIFFNLLIILQLIAGFLCIYYGLNLYMDNKVKRNVASTMMTKSTYRIESLYPRIRDENNINAFEKESLEAMKIFESKKENFISQSEFGILAKYFEGAEGIARYGRIETMDGEKYYDAGVITSNKLFMDYYNIKVEKGRLLTDEELELKFDKPRNIKVLAGYDYGKYFKIGDKISNLDNDIKELEIVGFLPKDVYINDFESGQKISLDKYIVAGYNINKNAEILLNSSVMDSAYLLYDKELNEDKIKELNDKLIQDFHSVYSGNIGLRNINMLNEYSNSIWENRLEFVMKMIGIIMVFIFSTIIVSTITLINKRKKEFAVHILSGATLKEICQIIFIEIYSLFIFSMVVCSTIIIFVNSNLNVKRLLIVNIMTLIIAIIISAIPIIIKKPEVNDVLRGE